MLTLIFESVFGSVLLRESATEVLDTFRATRGNVAAHSSLFHPQKKSKGLREGYVNELTRKIFFYAFYLCPT